MNTVARGASRVYISRKVKHIKLRPSPPQKRKEKKKKLTGGDVSIPHIYLNS